MAKFHCTNIDWETDGKRVKLPKEMIVEIDDESLEEADDEQEVNLLIANTMSDETGWLIVDCEWKPIP